MAEPSPPETEQRCVVADAIDRHREEIVARWLASVRAQLSDNRSASGLVGGVPDYLRELAQSLRRGDSVETSGAVVWSAIAQSQAVARIDSPFDIGELVEEFLLLGRVLLAFLDDKNLRELRYASWIAELVAGSAVAAVRTYVEARDHEIRQRQADYIAFITHELRNPLGTATLALAQLRKTLPPTSTLQARLYDLSERSLARLRRMIDKVIVSEQLNVSEVDS